MKRRKTGERHGVILVDKARGGSSAGLVAEVGRALGGVRAGHAGTLDPMATGLMIVCVGEGTKLATFLTGADKEYQAEALLGVRTDTLDADGARIGEPADAGAVTEADVRREMAALTGAIQQVPPMYSALKREGRPLYQLAREGREVERAARDITVFEFALTSFAPPRIGFRVRASKGTYVRVLAADLGERLGMGAHLTSLRRTRSGGFDVADATAQADLGPEMPLIGLADAMRGYPELQADETLARRLRDGQKVPADGLDLPAETPIAVLADGGTRLCAVAQISAGVLRSLRGFSS